MQTRASFWWVGSVVWGVEEVQGIGEVQGVHGLGVSRLFGGF